MLARVAVLKTGAAAFEGRDGGVWTRRSIMAAGDCAVAEGLARRLNGLLLGTMTQVLSER